MFWLLNCCQLNHESSKYFSDGTSNKFVGSSETGGLTDISKLSRHFSISFSCFISNGPLISVLTVFRNIIIEVNIILLSTHSHENVSLCLALLFQLPSFSEMKAMLTWDPIYDDYTSNSYKQISTVLCDMIYALSIVISFS